MRHKNIIIVLFTLFTIVLAGCSNIHDKDSELDSPNTLYNSFDHIT